MQIEPAALKRAKIATQLIFLVCGLGIAAWAPMVPYAKDRLALHEAHLGVLLLFLGGGALVMMPVSGMLVNRLGSRKVVLFSSILIALMLPTLLLIPSVEGMAVALMLFGVGIGSVDVAMNAHAVQVQNLYGRPVMSSVHGMYSVGGLLGALGLGFLIKLGLVPFYAAVGISVILLLIAISQYKYLFSFSFEKATIQQFYKAPENTTVSKGISWWRGSIFFLGFLCFAVFLAEGAILDWSAVFLRDSKGVQQEFSGVGFAAFSVAMAVMRLTGDGLVERWNNNAIVIGGSILAAIGFTITIISTPMALIVFGDVLVGLGCANMVPIFFSDGGKIPGVSPTISIPVITTLGYTGQLAGPALLGIVAHHFSIEAAFGCLVSLLLVVALVYFINGKIRKNKSMSSPT